MDVGKLFFVLAVRPEQNDVVHLARTPLDRRTTFSLLIPDQRVHHHVAVDQAIDGASLWRIRGAVDLHPRPVITEETEVMRRTLPGQRDAAVNAAVQRDRPRPTHLADVGYAVAVPGSDKDLTRIGVETNRKSQRSAVRGPPRRSQAAIGGGRLLTPLVVREMTGLARGHVEDGELRLPLHGDHGAVRPGNHRD